MCVFVFLFFVLMPVFVFVLQFILFTSLVIVFVTKIITTTINNIFFSSQQLAIFILAYSMRLISLPSCGCFGVLCMCLFKCPWLYASFIIVVTKIYYLYVCLFILCFLSFERAFLSLLKKLLKILLLLLPFTMFCNYFVDHHVYLNCFCMISCRILESKIRFV